MKLSKKSWHYKLNMWYTEGVPRSLCPYFWRTVWYIVTLPITIVLFIPWGIVLLITGDRENIVEEYPRALAMDILLGAAFCMIAIFWHLNPKEGDPWVVVWVLGLTSWLLLVIILIVYIGSLFEKRVQKKEKKPNILGEYLKARKNKYCPIIEWEE